jgi:hypothetical protein
MLINFTVRRLAMLAPALAVSGILFAGGLALASAQNLGYFAPTGENSPLMQNLAAAVSEER